MLKFIYLKPFLKKVIWANDNLKKLYQSEEAIGEAWLISALENNSSFVINKEVEEKTLLDFFNNHRSFFRNYNFQYPNLTKIIDAKTALSIQVHPNDEYAKKYNSLGKAEAWYVLENKGKEFILGTKIKNKQELKEVILSGDLEKELITKSLKKGDFVYIDHGQIHAIPEETMVYEIQQSSDITFRMYDYNRLDLNGQLRQLHIKESLDVVNLELEPKIISNQKQLINNKLFYLQKHEINHLETEKFVINEKFYWAEIVIVNGSGFIDEKEIKQGDAILLSGHFNSFSLSGNFTFLINLILEA